MSVEPLPLSLSRCPACHLRYVPRDGPCPKCGASRAEPYAVPPAGRVLAETDLSVPPPGWVAPHRLALIEVADGVRVLAVVVGGPLTPGDEVRVTLDGAVYRAARP